MRPIGIILHRIAALTATVFLTANVSADQTDEGPPPTAPVVRPEKGFDRPDQPRSGGDQSHRDKSRHRGAFDNLSDDERARIRSALQQVWSDPEVIAAKNALQAATEQYRKTLRTALGKADPEMQEILKKMMMSPHGPGGSGGPGGPPPSGTREWGDPNSPGFARGMLQRSQAEAMNRIPAELHESYKAAHKAAMESDSVKRALKAVEEAEDGRAKMDSARAVREAYREAMIKEDPNLRDHLTRDWTDRPKDRPVPPGRDNPSK